MDSRLAGAMAVCLIVAVGVVLAVSGPQAHDSFGVDARPSDSELQREDEVVVSERLGDIESELRLVTHRVDSIRGGDDVRHRVQFRLKTESLSSTQGTSRLVRLRERELETVGLRGDAEALPDAEALAYTDAGTEDGAVTVYLPRPSRVAEIDGMSYSFLVAHELGGASLRARTDEPGGREAPSEVTTDYVLARRGISEGMASYVGYEYVERYGGTFDPRVLRPERTDHPHDRVAQWMYYEGYEFAKARSGPSKHDPIDVRSTHRLLFPGVDSGPEALPNSSFAEQLDGASDPVLTDRPGALVVRTALVSRGVGLDRAEETVAGWRNGRVDRYLAEGTIVSVWTTVWANETAATTFARVYETNVPVTRADSFDSDECQSTERLLLVDDRRVTVVRCS